LVLAATFGTSASAGLAQEQRVEGVFITAGAPHAAPRGFSRDVSDEVAALRDHICEQGGLTRQQVARAIGVDRRSLTGWANGTIRPTQGRLESLRFLRHLVDEIEIEYPGRTRDVLLGAGPRGSAIDAIANGDLTEAANWRRHIATESTSTIQVTARKPSRQALYEPALAALLAGRLAAPERRPTLRPEEAYDSDPEQAHFFEEPDQAVTLRRRGYR